METSRIYEPLADEDIGETAQNIVDLANEHGNQIIAMFNEIELVVGHRESVNAIVQYYQNESSRRHEEWKASSEGQYATRKTEELRKQAEEATRVALAEGIKTFSLKDPDGWQKSIDVNKDGYGSTVIRYAARWANLMEQKMSSCAKLEDIAKATSYEADVEGITGFMYGCAVFIISQVWEHGEQLRRWHNCETQIGSEGYNANASGGVLNPALLSICPQ